MRAVWLTRFGGPEVLVAGDAPDPRPGPGQVVVAVAYANTTFVETTIRAGRFGSLTADDLPVIPGNGVGGVVAEAGAGVDPGLVGRRVVTSTGGSGAYAERVAVDAGAVFAVPDGLAMDDAVALLADGRTAKLLIAQAAPKPDERVVVEAAAGGVGSLLVQLARAAGARVVAAAGGARKLAVARDLGADAVVDYREPGWADGVRAGGPADVVFDGVGGEIGRAAFELLRPGGRMVRYGLASGAWAEITEDDAAARGVRLLGMGATPEEMRAFTEEALGDGAAGLLRPTIGQRFPLAGAAAAHTAIESRATVGKTLLEVAP
ncbi:MAG TPA: zinc-binding dehydrogenase [Streptosporangiaceae bacterium]|jgi:NADPH2:quinone reductase